ncbi:MAG: hypothetical protein D4R64_05395 [Porphyromonadaceae bacterium]|nr:MAG: hypothetical protein D4R64_05395 [Porphyromonadaceae bacterium]
MKAVALKVLTLCILTLVAFSCNKEDPGIADQLIGKWTLTDKTVGNDPVILSDCEKRSTIEFQVNNFCLLYDACTGDTTNSGWNYKYEMLNISVHLPAAYYIEQLDNTDLKVRRNDISPSGDLQVTVLSYSKELK